MLDIFAPNLLRDYLESRREGSGQLRQVVQAGRELAHLGRKRLRRHNANDNDNGRQDREDDYRRDGRLPTHVSTAQHVRFRILCRRSWLIAFILAAFRHLADRRNRLRRRRHGSCPSSGNQPRCCLGGRHLPVPFDDSVAWLRRRNCTLRPTASLHRTRNQNRRRRRRE